MSLIGSLFSHAFACVSSCSPSRSVLYTGLHTHSSGQYGLAHGPHNFHTRPGVKSLPGYLRPAGGFNGAYSITSWDCPAGELVWSAKIRNPSGTEKKENFPFETAN